MSGERSGEGEQGRLGDRAVLPTDLDEPVRPDPANRVPAKGTVVQVEEDSKDIFSEDRRAIVRADVQARQPSGIGCRERARDRRVEPEVRAS